MYQYSCKQCGKKTPVTTKEATCSCGGLFQLEDTSIPFSLDNIDTNCWNIFRYRKFMPLLGDSWKDTTLGEGMTPIISFDEHLMLKMDYMMPTLSFKDRGAAVLMSHCKDIGVTQVVQDSSGNAGNSVAAYGAKNGITCDIYVPEGTSAKKIAMIQSHGATAHVISGSRDHCADTCRATLKTEGKYYANHVYNPYFYEGTKTYIYEIYEQLGRTPNYLFIPAGNGTLLIGAVLGLKHLVRSGLIETFPQIVVIQSAHCAPLAKAYEKEEIVPAQVTPKPTLAEGIAIGVPMRGKEMLQMIYEHHMHVITVEDVDILPARQALAQKGIYCEHTTAANYAAYVKYCEIYGQISDGLLTICGAGLKSDK